MKAVINPRGNKYLQNEYNASGRVKKQTRRHDHPRIRRGRAARDPRDSHVRLSSPRSNDGLRILRRGYSFSEPVAPGSGEIDAGLFFIAFQRDPERQFVPIQRRLAGSDALSRPLLHTGSAVFACPPGTQPGGFVGEGLFA